MYLHYLFWVHQSIHIVGYGQCPPQVVNWCTHNSQTFENSEGGAFSIQSIKL